MKFKQAGHLFVPDYQRNWIIPSDQSRPLYRWERYKDSVRPRLAPAVVQSTSFIKQGFGFSTSSNSFGSLPTVGNLIIVTSVFYNTTDQTFAVSDNQSNTYANDVTVVLTSLPRLTISSAKVVTSSGTFTVTLTGNSNSAFSWAAMEVSGMVSALWLDQIGTGAAVSTPLTATCSGANSQNNEFVVAVAYPPSDTPSGYTEYWNDQTLIGGASDYEIINGAETSSATWNSNIIATSKAIIATYKAAAGVGGSVVPEIMNSFRQRRAT